MQGNSVCDTRNFQYCEEERHGENKMKKLCKHLIKEWCEGLLRHQITESQNSEMAGGIKCPACGMIHGRCFEAMYPFLYMAESEKDKRWTAAAEALFCWAERTVSQEDGSFLNDVDSDWKGTTVFNAIQLADCLLLHGTILSKETRNAWKQRLKKAAEFLYSFEALNDNNINYPISNALALYECGLVLKEDRYKKRAEELAALAQSAITQNGLLFGEGVPRFQKSPKGCYPVDIGYNIEETLPSLALYGYLSGNKKAVSLAEKGLSAHLSFLLENGAWDNSFGTRNYKWTYWGSRTSDGCALGYLLLADNHPEFAEAAKRNLRLLSQCTEDGLLYGGPHYRAAGQEACVHHTFTHAKVVAGILDRSFCEKEDKKTRVSLPREKEYGIRYYPELESWTVNQKTATATVTAYDWEYLPGGHVSGGTLSLYHHKQGGTLLCAGMGDYTRKEPNNMQSAHHVRQECLALRIDAAADGVLYSSIYEDSAEVRTEVQTDEKNQAQVVRVSGNLKDIRHHSGLGRLMPYRFTYRFRENRLEILAEFEEGILICPLISRVGEVICCTEDKRSIQIAKTQGAAVLETPNQISLPYGTERIFNLVPGFQAVRIDLRPEQGRAEFCIKFHIG